MAAVSPVPAGVRSKPEGVWLHGPASDLLLGCGLLYLLSMPLVYWWAGRTGASAWPSVVVMLIAVGVSGPHYGATLLRVYERSRDRRRYRFFATYVTAVLALFFGLGLYDAAVGSWLLTIYVTWSPWHFAGQNFGLALMTLRRRGVPIDATLKRLLYASFILSFLLATLPLHMSGSELVFAQGTRDGGGIFDIVRLGIPFGLARTLAIVFGVAYLSTLAAVGVRLLRAAALRDLVPALLIVVTQATWFAIPAFGIASGGWGHLGLAFAAIWISCAHALQYLWVTSYYAKQRGDASGVPSYLLKTALVSGLLIIPQLLFAPAILGDYAPNALGVAVLAFSVVNLHHFILDGAIWKLRDGPVARVLLGGSAAEDDDASDGFGLLRAGLFALGALCVLHAPFVLWQRNVATRTEGATRAQVEAAASRLAFLGIERWPVLANVGLHRERDGDRAGAIEAYGRAFELAPEETDPVLRAIELLLDGDSADRMRALELSRDVVERTERSDPRALRSLAMAANANGRTEEAAGAASEAKAIRRERESRAPGAR